MRRSTAISQVLLLLAFYALPLLASSDATLPACCRRNGAHHCEMMAAADAGQSTAAGQLTFHNPVHCPYRFPTSILTHTTKLFLVTTSSRRGELVPRQFAATSDSDRVLLQSATALDNRGPPALTL